MDAKQDRRSKWLSNADITDTLKSLAAKHVMVIADSCYSGTLTRSAAVGLRDANYLKRMSKKRARVPLVSEGLEPVEDDGDDGNPPFARAFLKALSNNTDVIDGSSPRFGAPSSCTQSKRPSIPTSVIQAMTAAIFCSCACHKAQQGRLDPLRKPPPRHLIS